MGSARPRPERLSEKLLQIRTTLGLSQPELHRRLGVEHLIDYTKISTYELGKREPPLMILLEYARLANVYVDALIDDSLDLPDKLPSPTKSEGVRRITSRLRGKNR
jgi:transcriptional regulator with XRE-family HTH domain